MSATRLSPEVLQLIERVADHPAGLQLLLGGHLESVSALFGAHPTVIDSVRGMLGEPAERAPLLRALAEARRERKERGASTGAPAPAATEMHIRSADELIEEIGGVPWGMEFLFHGSPEILAVLFETHPFTVLRAREILLQRGVRPADAGTEGTGEAFD